MKRMNFVAGIVSAVFMFAASPSLADVIQDSPPYPAPGGNIASGSGNPTQGTGITWTLSDFDFSAFHTLYYAIGRYQGSSFNPDGPMLSMDGTLDVLMYQSSQSDLPNGKVVWTGTTFLTWLSGGVWITSSVNTRFTLTITDMSNNPIPLTDAGSIPGMPVSVGGAHTVTGDFNANWLFEAQAPDNGLWEPAGDMFDRIENDPNYQLNINVGGAFYYIPDSDGDGIPDDEDDCSESNIDETIVVDACDSEVENQIFENGCSMADLIAECAEAPGNHGEFVSCVAHLTNDWKEQELISGKENGAVQSCSAKADIP